MGSPAYPWPKTSTRRLGTALKEAMVFAVTVTPLILTPLFSLRAEDSPRPTEQELQETKTWIYSLALQAATYGTPIVAMYNLRESNAVGPNAKVHPGQIWRMDTSRLRS